ncbi:uncharacterized protein [Physcomitrium patens]|uniref:AB hydrolase-1 domain-containing protein n=1 Tax=Physcomitrium patens TaxID=3218 RepID=A0A2K1IUS5_PHYPA|nr:uncharacterized protein LOC112272922 [Physcomitrium patens]PNR33029.1 hypothetical protein PHYPA_024972 [Physcomitrium patens]|eukprot:XP_024356867.1 uncharacterized protein LOC112272922 [Physcomitrella patens]
MGGCLDFSVVEFKLSRLRRHYKACGLKSEMIDIDNETRMHCWTPTPPIAEAGVWSVPTTKPSLLLLQGFAPEGMLCWENQIAAFARDYNVYVPDLLFLGKSVTESKQRSETFQAECIAKMLQMLGVQNEVHVVGTSYGGMVAFRMAEKYPEFVNKLVLSSSGICMAPDNDKPLLKKHGFSHISQILIPSEVVEVKAAIAAATVKPPWLPNFVYRDILKVLHEEQRVERKQLLDALVIGTEKAFPLPKLTQPKVLILWGEHDQIFNKELAYKLQEHLGNRSEVVMMTNCGHVPQLENSREYNRIVLDFLRDRQVTAAPRAGQVAQAKSSSSS